MYTIKRAAELTGVSPATMRAWERRYDVVGPARSEGRYRLYSDADVRALTIMASLVNQGWSAREAAQETNLRTAGMPGARSDAQPQPPAGLDDIVHAAQALDSDALGGLLDARLGAAPYERVVDEWLHPTLAGVGDAWADGRLSVAGEHLVSNAVQRRLAAAYESSARRASGPKIVLGLPPGARHELGLLSFAVAARRAGFATAYVGADLPAQEWMEAIDPRNVAAVVVAVPMLADVAAARDIGEGLRSSHPDMGLMFGGAHQQEALVAGAIALGHQITRAVSALDEALRGVTRNPPMVRS